jgi:hypothetical protein
MEKTPLIKEDVVAYASFRCPIEAPQDVIWGTLLNAIGEAPQPDITSWQPLEQEAAWLMVNQLHWPEEVLINPHDREIILRLGTAAPFTGTRSFRIKSDPASGQQHLECVLNWRKKSNGGHVALQDGLQDLVKQPLLKAKALIEDQRLARPG